MWWQVRALLEDRPGGLAAVATLCGAHGVNILGLQIFPTAAGGVVDELVLCTPGGWDGEDVAALFERAGVAGVSVGETSPDALEDQPTRYLRSARVLRHRPELLVEELCRLLGAAPDDGSPGLELLVLDGEDGPEVRLQRDVPFTDTEVARAVALRELAAAGEVPDGAPVAGAVTGSRLVGADACAVLRGAAVDAADRGEQSLRFFVRADDRGVLPVVHAAGLRARLAPATGVVEVTVPVGDLRGVRG